MSHDMLVKADGRAVASSFSLETQSRLINGKSPNRATVPETVVDSMNEQGMATGSFTPGEPISPYQSVGTAPIITPYQVGSNIFAVPRGVTGVGFDALKGITDVWDVANLCMEVRLDELRGLDWEIVVDDDYDSDMYESEVKAARKFFEHPSPGHDFDDLQTMAGTDWLKYDALSIAMRKTRNGKYGAMEAIDGTTVAPLIDARGAIPQGPAPAYVQWAWGLPWVWLTDDDIIYKPNHPSPSTRYGRPPAEWVMLLANTDIRLQWYFLTYFTEGEVPEVFINAPPDVAEPKQVKALQDAYSSVMTGKSAVHHKVKWIPPGANVHGINKANFDVDFAGWQLSKGCAAYKVQPAEIGYTEKVNKSSGDTQADITYRRTIKPTVKYWESIWNRVLRDYLKMPFGRFRYLDVEEEEDQLKQAQARAIYIQNAVLAADEVRQELGYDIDPDAPVGRGFATRTGVIFVDAKSQAAARAAGNLAQVNGTEPIAADPNGQDDTNDDATDDDPALLSPNQAIVDPALKPMPPKPGQPGDPQAAPAKSVESELRKWRQVAVKRAKDGKAQKVFQSDLIDPFLHKSLTNQLAKAKSADEVREVFSSLLGGDADPFEKRANKKGRKVARDIKAKDTIQRRMKASIAEILNAQAPKVAAHMKEALSNYEQTAAGQESPDPIAIELMLAQFGWQGWDKQLKDTVSPELAAMYKLANVEGVTAAGGNPAFDLIDPHATEYAENRAAELVGKKRVGDILVDNGEWSIPDTTRTMIHDNVVSGIKEGKSPYEIEKAIREHYAFSERRAETIARTETGFAYNGGSVQGFRDAKVQHVEVSDGDDDPPCAEADGSIWTLEQAEANPLAHPNCTRAFLPIPPDEDPDYIPVEEGS